MKINQDCTFLNQFDKKQNSNSRKFYFYIDKRKCFHVKCVTRKGFYLLKNMICVKVFMFSVMIKQIFVLI